MSLINRANAIDRDTTDDAKKLSLYLLKAVETAETRCKEVRQLKPTGSIPFGGRISDQLAADVPDILAELKRILVDPNSSVETKLESAKYIAKIQTRVASVDNARVAREISKDRTKRAKSIDKRAKLVEQKRIDRLLNNHIKSIQQSQQ
jgi:hypothetical protein